MTLLIDADDTLWENIVVFHRINAQFADWVAPARDEVDVRLDLDEIQRSMVATHGYGRQTFERALVEGVRQIGGREPSDADRSRVQDMVAPLQWQTLDLIEGVEGTLTELAARHELIVVTKGNEDEQRTKLERSGLAHHFVATEILVEKNTDAYERVIATHGLDVASTWMVGNSPRSDIIPALDAGLGAVYIPHAETWSLEIADVPDHERMLQLESFAELLDHF